MGHSIIEHTVFKNRKDAGVKLADKLLEQKYENPVVLTLPRGGVPVGAEIAKKLHAPMDLLLVQKLGVRGQEELALGAVIDGPAPLKTVFGNMKRLCGVTDDQLEAMETRALAEIERRRALYLHGRPPVKVRGSTAILVDDGIATGATVNTALAALRKQSPAHLVLAVGVAPPDVVRGLYSQFDGIFCLHQPEPFHSVGFHFQDFSQVSDLEVIDLLDDVSHS